MNAEEQARHDEFERQQKIRAAAYDDMITLVGQAAPSWNFTSANSWSRYWTPDTRSWSQLA
ncbi:hypothetical protein [Streptomyces sp. NPDC056987]|uniref:hypothetical protein n=1 Tax=Streptomyces sp. NPDC056987 TaxID=3345988 RepID=UPI00364271BB